MRNDTSGAQRMRASNVLKSRRNLSDRKRLRFTGEILMRTEPADHDIFETLLRRTITESVITGLDHGISGATDLVTRLRHYARRAHQEELSPQTLQVIASARRLLGDRPGTRLAS
ncbi:hypothetical protein [Methylobacterium sp. GC_Met_2]|uniref:hypothetical protein n=1 Tax=Methylobacterium sp. GC_Met_2 TaxID=2937376 RepID=UPI00226B1A59|nr:hypothetical protein [Methylobacterium sp. GC_Met_2]